MIIGHGIDLVETARIGELCERHGERFLQRCFTDTERDYCGRHRQSAKHFAARFAAKEAVVKAMGTGIRDGIGWTQIEVTRDPAGRPGVALSGRAAELASEQGITQWALSLTHTRDHAMASVIATDDD
ncbi:MAG: holo-ACP synthase [Phycisphaeraceae bacterium]|nr:holo-ACP synthase [Phycisphaeraceae bacterium]